MAVIRSHNGVQPEVAPSAFVAETAALIGSVRVGPDSSIWYGATLRGDVGEIIVGARTSIQDGCVLHCEPGLPCIVGDDVTVGHNATVHGCTIEDGAVIGIGATVLNAAVVGKGAVVAAGALVKEGGIIPPGTVAMGVPAKMVRDVTEEEKVRFRDNAAEYVRLAREFLTHV